VPHFYIKGVVLLFVNKLAYKSMIRRFGEQHLSKESSGSSDTVGAANPPPLCLMIGDIEEDLSAKLLLQ
jgi:hypothetical protein